MNLHHGRDQLADHLDRDGVTDGARRAPLGRGARGAGHGRGAGALRDWIAGRGVLVHNADVWCQADLAAFVAGWDGERVRVLVTIPTGEPVRFGPRVGPGGHAAALARGRPARRPSPSGLYETTLAPAWAERPPRGRRRTADRSSTAARPPTTWRPTWPRWTPSAAAAARSSTRGPDRRPGRSRRRWWAPAPGVDGRVERLRALGRALGSRPDESLRERGAGARDSGVTWTCRLSSTGAGSGSAWAGGVDGPQLAAGGVDVGAAVRRGRWR